MEKQETARANANAENANAVSAGAGFAENLSGTPDEDTDEDEMKAEDFEVRLNAEGRVVDKHASQKPVLGSKKTSMA